MQKQVNTLVVDFSIQGDAAYLSHQETLKMFQRALIRSEVPFVYSNGFNPHPHLSIPFPRSVGTQSVGDRVCATVQLPESPSVQDWRPRIQEQLPAGCSVLDIQSISGKCMFHPQSVRYIFHLRVPLGEEIQSHLDRCRKQIKEKSSIEIQRYWAKKRRYKQFDLSSYLESLDFADDRIEVVCGVSQSGTVRVDEIMQWLQLASEQLAELVCRTEIKWCQN
jgi:radical SAM-linked protein